MIKNREEIPNILPNNIVGCELGVFLCEYSEILLSSKKFDKLYLVDTFNGNIASGDKTGNNIKHFDGQYLLYNANQKFSHINNIHIIQNNSINFLQQCQDKYFDFIYIDTVHTYDHLMKELEESQRVIKLDGFICGHDYNINVFPGVVAAVNDFCNTNGFTFTTTTQDILESFIIKIN